MAKRKGDQNKAKKSGRARKEKRGGQGNAFLSRFRGAVEAEARAKASPYKSIPEPPPGVLPKGLTASKIAMDSGFSPDAINGWAGGYYGGNTLFSQGLEFLGYPYLAELAQVAEYRKPVEIIAEEMTRKWITIEATGDDKDDKKRKEKIDAINKYVDALGVRDQFRALAEQDGMFGRSHLYIDTGDEKDPNELIMDLGNGRDKVSKAKINRKHAVRAIKTIEAVWTYPQNYNANNPLLDDWYKPKQWYVQGQQLHVSRLLTMIGRPVPDLLKPSYSFGGLSLMQMLKPYVQNWLQTRQSVNDIIQSFTTYVLSTEMGDQNQVGAMELMIARAVAFNTLRNNRGLLVVDKENEEFKNVSAPLAGLDTLQAQAQQHMAAVASIPLVKMFGIQPAGLNASSDGEIRCFYDTIAARQEALFRRPLTTVLDMIQLSLFDEVDESITFKFVPLYALDEKSLAEVDKTKAETAQVRIDSGVVSQEEERERLASDPDGPYPGLDPDELPDLLKEEEAGLEPEGGRPELQAQELEEAA